MRETPASRPPSVGSSPADESLVRRLDAYLANRDGEPVPSSLQHTTLADVRAAHTGSLFGSPRLMAFAGAMATVVLLLGCFAIARRGTDPAATNLGVGASSSSTSAAQGAHNTTSCCEPARGAETTIVADPSGSSLSASDPSGSSSTTGDSATTNLPTTTAAGTPSTQFSTTIPFTTRPTVSTTTVTPTTSTPATSTTTPSGDLFFEDFTAYTPGTFPNANGWANASGSASVITNASPPRFLRNDTPRNSEGRASAGSAAWANYAVSATIKMDANARVAGLAARFQDAGNYLFCKMSFDYGGTNSNKLWLGVNENSSPTLSTPAKNVSWSAGQLYVMTLTVVGNNATCAVDGVATLSGSSSRFPSGKIATVGDGVVGFTNVRVQAR